MIKVSVGKTKRTGLLARIIALILQILVPRRVYLATIKGVFYWHVPFNFVEVIWPWLNSRMLEHVNVIRRSICNYRPTIDRVSTECRPTIDRVSTAISTDISRSTLPTVNKIHEAYPCRSVLDFKNGNCRKCNGECPTMGYRADETKQTGTFYLKTNSKAPFCGEQILSEDHFFPSSYLHLQR